MIENQLLLLPSFAPAAAKLCTCCCRATNWAEKICERVLLVGSLQHRGACCSTCCRAGKGLLGQRVLENGLWPGPGLGLGLGFAVGAGQFAVGPSVIHMVDFNPCKVSCF